MNTEKIIKLRIQTHKLLASSENGKSLSRMIDFFLIVLITINVLAVILETISSFQVQYAQEFYWLEVFSIGVFTLEYLLRVWSCVEDQNFNHYSRNLKTRLKFMITPMAIIDLIAILPFYLAALGIFDLRFLRVLRLARIFKLTRYSGTMSLMLRVLREESGNFAAAIFVMTLVMVIAASGIYLVEHNVQPDKFGSIPQSMWWAIVTLTTVGYGDVTPFTFAGKLFATCIMVAGVGLVALPTGILASSFSENLNRSRATMTKELTKALEDGEITAEERKTLDALSRKLGLSDQVLAEIQHSLIEQKAEQKANGIGHPPNCPHCGKRII